MELKGMWREYNRGNEYLMVSVGPVSMCHEYDLQDHIKPEMETGNSGDA